MNNNPKEQQEMRIKIINTSEYPLPQYTREGDAGMDIRWNAPNDTVWVLRPLERHAFPTGNYVELSEGYEFQIRPRSGLAFKHGLTVLNSPGTIDSNYRGEIKVILVNLSNEAVTIHGGDRIAQMVLAKVGHVDWDLCEELEVTERGHGGFGHTGLK